MYLSNEISGIFARSASTIDQAQLAFGNMQLSMQKNHDLIKKISVASQNQAEDVKKIEQGTNSLGEAARNNASTSEQLAATAEEMQTAAIELHHLMQFFKD